MPRTLNNQRSITRQGQRRIDKNLTAQRWVHDVQRVRKGDHLGRADSADRNNAAADCAADHNFPKAVFQIAQRGGAQLQGLSIHDAGSQVANQDRRGWINRREGQHGTSATHRRRNHNLARVKAEVFATGIDRRNHTLHATQSGDFRCAAT